MGYLTKQGAQMILTRTLHAKTCHLVLILHIIIWSFSHTDGSTEIFMRILIIFLLPSRCRPVLSDT